MAGRSANGLGTHPNDFRRQAMTLPHDCEARMLMLQETIERNRENLIEHTLPEANTKTATTADTK